MSDKNSFNDLAIPRDQFVSSEPLTDRQHDPSVGGLRIINGRRKTDPAHRFFRPASLPVDLDTAPFCGHVPSYGWLKKLFTLRQAIFRPVSALYSFLQFLVDLNFSILVGLQRFGNGWINFVRRPFFVGFIVLLPPCHLLLPYIYISY